MRFEKWQALGNDYLIFEEAELTPAQVHTLCDPHFGPGADGVLILTKPDEPGYVARLRIFNPDGSEAELSGNGAREAIMYLRRNGWTEPTRSASRRSRARSGRRSPARRPAASTWAAPHCNRPTIPVVRPTDGARWPATASSTSRSATRSARSASRNPTRLDLQTLGPEIENAPIFPNRTNVSFWKEIAPDASAPGSSSAAWGRR